MYFYCQNCSKLLFEKINNITKIDSIDLIGAQCLFKHYICKKCFNKCNNNFICKICFCKLCKKSFKYFSDICYFDIDNEDKICYSCFY